MLTSQDRFISMKTSRVRHAARRPGRRVPARRAGDWRRSACPSGTAWIARRAEAIAARAHGRTRSAWACSVRASTRPDRSGYLLLFEIISVHLLVVLIGRRVPGPGQAEKESPRSDERHESTAACQHLLTEPVGVSHYLVVGAVLFVCGALCMATKRNALGVLMGIELVLNGANLNFIAFGSPYLRSDAEHARPRRPADVAVRDRAGRGRGGRGAGHRAEFLQQLQHDRRRSGGSAARLEPQAHWLDWNVER